MIVELKRTDVTAAVFRADLQVPRGECAQEHLIEPIPAAVTLNDFRAPIGFVNSAAWFKNDCIRCLNQTAFQECNDGTGTMGCGLGVLRITPSQYVAGVFHDGVLKATACSEERAARLTGKPDRAQGTFHVSIGAARNAPQTIDSANSLDIEDFVGGNPLEVQANPELIGGKTQCRRDRLVGSNARVVIAD
jgi:hypothetical protein